MVVTNPLNRASLRLYRLLLRECRQLQRSSTSTSERHLMLSPPLDPRDWGRARLISASSSHNGTPHHAPTSKTVLEFLDRASSSAPTGEDDASVFVSASDVTDTVRSSFRDTALHTDCLSSRQAMVLHHQQRAIEAVKVLQTQRGMADRTFVTTDEERGLRVVATSRCIGRSVKSPMAASRGQVNNRFAYRIRVENMGTMSSTTSDGEDVSIDSGKPVQLLGRYFRIEEERDDDGDKEDAEPVIVKAPTTGAVGHLPVIHPGEIFEYMSGCELSTDTGFMSGHFFMAEVEQDTPSAMVGDVVKALKTSNEKKDDDDTLLFEMPIGPFRLS